MSEQKNMMKDNWKSSAVFVILFIAFMLLSIRAMYSSKPGLVVNGKVDLNKNELVKLDGNWEFYWGRLLTSKDFNTKHMPQMNSFMKVPGSWNDKKTSTKSYPNHGVATYRLLLKYPSSIKDPALSIKTVSAAYKLYANGQLIAGVGKVSNKISEYKGDYRQFIVELPKDKQKLELLFQVANLDYTRGGLRDSLTFGSKQLLELQKLRLLSVQLIFIGIVAGFSFYYFQIFLLQRKNKVALIFSILCFISALRASVWGEMPLFVFYPNMTIQTGLFINYITEYNLIPLIILFVISLYPSDNNKRSLVFILLPTLFFNTLLFAPDGFRASLNNYSYVLMMVQMIYILGVLIKSVLDNKNYARLLLVAIGIFILTIIDLLFEYIGIGNNNLSYLFLYGNFIVILAMSYIQAKQQAIDHEKLILYNEKLVEADKLKDRIMATEMSFLQAQIKPHFLYNALNAIANVCETNGEKAGELIIDLAVYLRGSLEFNNLDKMVAIEKELEFVDRYFHIEQARFGEKIKLSKEIEIPTDSQIPVLILQPLVENAVRHGISKKKVGGTVYIRMKQKDEGIYIQVEDNGVGMDNEKLTMLFNETKAGQGVGIYNIHNRLLRLYGKGLEISSKVGQGTCVKLVIPERRLDDDKDCSS